MVRRLPTWPVAAAPSAANAATVAAGGPGRKASQRRPRQGRMASAAPAAASGGDAKAEQVSGGQSPEIIFYKAVCLHTFASHIVPKIIEYKTRNGRRTKPIKTEAPRLTKLWAEFRPQVDDLPYKSWHFW